MSDKLIYDAKEPLQIAGGRPVSDAFLNQFYGTVSLSQIQRFEKLYRDRKTEVEIIGMTPAQFIVQINNSFTRHQEHRRLDAFLPMDDKGLKYVLDFLEESITSVAKEVQKKAAKSLIR